MSPAIAERKRSRSRKKQKRPPFSFLWPLPLFCIFTPLAVRAASLLALSGPSALRLLFPWMAIVPAGVPAAIAMWAQFPVYGALVSCFAFRHRTGVGLLAMLLLHVLAAAAAFTLPR